MNHFRLPTTELNRGFRKVGVSLVAGLILAHFLTPNGISISTIILAATIGVAGYFYTKQHVWLSLSADGISGKGYTNRKVEIAWSTAVTMNAARMSNMDGFEIRASENDSAIKRKILSLFIPRAIADTPDFSATVAKFAPTDHPLRRLSGNAV